MQTITLKGITRKGKNRVTEHGSIWEVIPAEVVPAPMTLFIKSVKTQEKRWLTSDFEIVTLL